MRALDTLAATLGPPRVLREVAAGGRMLAAVGRWRHRGASVDLGDTDAVHLVFNVSGGQLVELRRPDGSAVRGPARAGSVGVNFPGTGVHVTITGPADTVQLVVTPELIEAVSGRPALPALPASALLPSALLPRRLQALGTRALVALDALARGWGDPPGRDARAELDALAWEAATLLALPSGAPDRFVSRLSAAARRRVRALLDARLGADPVEPPTVRELAAAAGLSAHHFAAAFRASEAETPHARVTALQLQKALGLLLRPDARVADVAGRAGFASPSHFVSSFRRHVGVTPGAVRDAAQDAARAVRAAPPVPTR